MNRKRRPDWSESGTPSFPLSGMVSSLAAKTLRRVQAFRRTFNPPGVWAAGLICLVLSRLRAMTTAENYARTARLLSLFSRSRLLQAARLAEPPTLGEHGAFHAKLLVNGERRGFVTTNSAIEMLDSERMVLLSRRSNTVWSPNGFQRTRKLSREQFCSHLSLSRGNQNGPFQVASQSNANNEPPECNRFDPRLYWTRGGLRAIFCSSGVTPADPTWFQNVGTVSQNSGTITEVYRLHDSKCQPSEKNWMPISDPASSLDSFLYSVYPTQVIDFVQGKLIWREPQAAPRDLQTARGGSQLVALGSGEFLSVVHHTKLWPVRHYTHRFVFFSLTGTTMSVKLFSQEFFLKSAFALEVATGLVVTGGIATLSFGFGETRTFLAQMPLGRIHELCVSSAQR